MRGGAPRVARANYDTHHDDDERRHDAFHLLSHGREQILRII